MNSDHVCGCCGKSKPPPGTDYRDARAMGCCCAGTVHRGSPRVGAIHVGDCGGYCYGACRVQRYPCHSPDYRPPYGPYSYGDPNHPPPAPMDIAAMNMETRETLLAYKDMVRGRGINQSNARDTSGPVSSHVRASVINTYDVYSPGLRAREQEAEKLRREQEFVTTELRRLRRRF